MRLLFCALVLLTSNLINSQQNDSAKYRFNVSMSAMSTMNYGFKSFYDLNSSSVLYGTTQSVYNNEKYTVNYQNLNFSKDFDVQLSVNWLNSDKYILRQSFSMFIGAAAERATLTLTSFDEKTGIENFYPEYQYWADNLAIGYETNYRLESGYVGFFNQIMVLKKFKKSLNVGVGLSTVGRFRKEFNPIFEEGYLYNRSWDPLDSYYTRQLCISTQIEKSKGRFSGFINLSESIFILKKAKGHNQVADGELLAVSNNLDYRFPLYIKAGVSINFKSIKE